MLKVLAIMHMTNDRVYVGPHLRGQMYLWNEVNIPLVSSKRETRTIQRYFQVEKRR
jgi:hypothetical protein